MISSKVEFETGVTCFILALVGGFSPTRLHLAARLNFQVLLACLELNVHPAHTAFSHSSNPSICNSQIDSKGLTRRFILLLPTQAILPFFHLYRLANNATATRPAPTSRHYRQLPSKRYLRLTAVILDCTLDCPSGRALQFDDSRLEFTPPPATAPEPDHFRRVEAGRSPPPRPPPAFHDIRHFVSASPVPDTCRPLRCTLWRPPRCSR